MPYAVIFPGQGAATPGAGHPGPITPPGRGRREAEAVLGRPLARLLLEADAAELATTRASQLAVLLGSLVAWDALRPELDEAPVAFAGHSLGQITALIAAGAVDRSDGLRLAARRADLSQESADANPGRMAALVGTDLDVAARVVRRRADDVWIANDNAPGQVVIAGTPEGLDAAAERARDLGVRRVMPLDVGHAFHTPLLADAAEGLAAPARRHAVPPSPPPPSSPTPTPSATPTPPAGPTSWPATSSSPCAGASPSATLAASGAATFVEVGPGKVLAGLAKRTVPDVTVLDLTAPADLSPVAGALAPTGAPR